MTAVTPHPSSVERSAERELPGPPASGRHDPAEPPRLRSVEPSRREPPRFVTYVVMRLALIPIQLVFVLFLLYIAIEFPLAISTNPHLSLVGYFQGFAQMVVNIFSGNWGMGPERYGLPYSQLYADFLPNSVELALFALPIAAAIAYPVSLLLGWTRRPEVDVPARLVSLTGSLLPVFVVATLVIYAFFWVIFDAFGEIDIGGLMPSVQWILTHNNERFPSWIIDGVITRPTGFPLIDGAIHQWWSFELLTLTKTLIQALVIAVAYVAIFLRHARTIVASASEELHVTTARARGVPEETLLWRHTARRVLPTLLLVVALTVPGYLATQFVVEAAFSDPGIGYLTVVALTEGGFADLPALEGLIFVLSAFVLCVVFVVDIVANRLDPRGAIVR